MGRVAAHFGGASLENYPQSRFQYPPIKESLPSYTKVDDHTLEFKVKNGGKVTTNGRVVVSADGKSRTVTTSGTEPQGKKFKSTAVYDKQ